jgi:acyl-CoA synthetase (AMP-forming)/AMP-acid ligase II
MEFNLADLFERVADAVPDRLALIAGDRRLSYSELDARASRVAHHLRDAGVPEGAWVGIHSYNRAEWLEAMIGCFKARCAPINVNYRYVADELQYLFDNADLVALIYEAEFGPLVERVAPRLDGLRHFVRLDDETGTTDSLGATGYEVALAGASPERDFAPRSPDDLYVLYTGGTTGMPKGVMWRQEDIFFAAMGGGNYGGPSIPRPEQIADNLSSSPLVTLALAPLMHGNAQWTSFVTLFGGNTLVLSTDRKLDADAVWDLIGREGVNTISLVGDAMARPLVDALAQRDPPPTLFALVSGGAILSPAIKAEMNTRMPTVMVLDSFGASETGANGAVDVTEKGPRFRMNEWTTVVDEHFEVAPVGTVGMLARRGHVPLGYWKDAGKSAATFIEVGDVRWAIPGDQAVIETDGTITVLGRGSQCINTGGEKVFPEEVEAALKSHPAVFDATVVGVPDTRWGEHVAAIVQFRPGTKASLDELAAHSREHIAGYKVPRAIVVVDEIVRSPSGKPDYRWAKQRAAAEQQDSQPA